MRKAILCVAGLAMALGAASAGQAAQGCGRGGHRGPRGVCRPNGGPVLVPGRYYHGHGYWDGRRYWQHRERWHGGWRYR